MRDFGGKVVVITGAASGIGQALAVAMAGEGAELALVDTNGPGLQETARRVDRSSPRVTLHTVDVSDRTAMQHLADVVEHRHGGADVVINNAGVGCVATLEDTTYEDLQWVLAVDLWGVIHGVKAFLPLLRRRPAGHIVNVASLAAFAPFPTQGAYNIAKFGVDALSQTLMSELRGSSITVSCVYPGGVSTGIAQRARHGTGLDAAAFDRRALTTPTRAAQTILRGIKADKETILVGFDARLAAAARRMAPGITRHAITWGWRRITAPRQAPVSTHRQPLWPQ